MTWDQIKDWLEKNGWKPRSPDLCGDAQGVTDAREGRMWEKSVPAGLLIVHMMKRNIRVVFIGKRLGFQRLTTVHPKQVSVENGLLRGLGLYTRGLLKEEVHAT